jgi:hypothetical protein
MNISTKKLVTIAAVLDCLWATLVATFASSFVLTLFHYAHGTHSASVIGGVAAWIIVFVLCAIQGAVSLFLVCCLLTVFGAPTTR